MKFMPIPNNDPVTINRALEEIYSLITSVEKTSTEAVKSIQDEAVIIDEEESEGTGGIGIEQTPDIPSSMSASTGADEETQNVVDAYIVFTWANVGPDRSYELQYKPSTASDYSTMSVPAQSSGNITARVGKLQTNTVFNWRVRSILQGTATEWIAGANVTTWSPTGGYISHPIRNFQIPHRFNGCLFAYASRLGGGTTTISPASGKAWYILKRYYDGTAKVFVNDVDVTADDSVDNIIYYDSIISSSDHVDLQGGVASTAAIWYMEVDEDSEVTPVPVQAITSVSTYTVPASKILVLRTAKASVANWLRIDDVNYFTFGTYLDWRNIALIFSAGKVLKASGGTIRFYGYLLPA